MALRKKNKAVEPVTPEEVAKVKGSYTGQYLKGVLQEAAKKGQLE